MRVRVKYSVSGKIRFISHLDLMRAFFRACIKKDIPVAVSQGFSPHLKISFGPPLSVGMTSSEEYLDMYVNGPVDKDSLQEGLPEGIKILDVYEVPEGEPSLCVSLNRAVYIIKAPSGQDEMVIDVPIGQGGGVKLIDVLGEIWPELGPDELKLCRVHREKLYNERNTN